MSFFDPPLHNNVIYYFPGVTTDVLNFYPKADSPRSNNPKKEAAAASRDNPSPPPAAADHKLLPRSSADDYDILKKKNETTKSDIPSPSPADNLPCSSSPEKMETISDIPSPSPAGDNILEKKETLSPAISLPVDNILKKKETLSQADNETISDDMRRPRVGIFSDYGKQARDILNKYYGNNYSNPKNKEFFFGLGASSSHANFLFNAYPEEEGFSLGEFSAAPCNDIERVSGNSVDIKTNAELDGFSTHVVSEIVPKALNGFITMKYPDLDGTSKVGIQCLFPPYATFTAATFTSATLKNNFSKFHYSGSIGYGRFSMGGDFVISDPNSSYPYVDIKDYSCGIRFMNSAFDANIGFMDKGDTLSASCVHYVDEMKKSCAVAEYKRNVSTNENTLTIGGNMEWKYNTKTTLLKAKVDNHGQMGVVLQQQLFRNSKIRISSEFNHKDLNKTPMIGMSLILN